MGDDIEAMPGFFGRWVAHFRAANWPSRMLVVVCLLINGIVLTNAVLNDPYTGPDYSEHLRYVATLAKFHLPTPLESGEYYSPPLPYLFPAFLMSSGSIGLWWAAKWAQFLNLLLSIGLTIYLIKICELVKPGDVFFKLASVAFLGLLTVYYKTFAWVRDEPFLAFLVVVLVHYTLLVFVRRVYERRTVVTLGLSLGLLALSEQWGLLLVPALILFVGILALKESRERLPYLKALAISLIIAFGVAGWFYLGLRHNYGTTMGLSRERGPQFSLANQPASFYFGLNAKRLFTEPVRPGITNQLIPVFYSDIWGDYRANFIVLGTDMRTGKRLQGRQLEETLKQTPVPDWFVTNRATVAPYLGRVNLLSLLPSALACGGLLFGVLALWRLLRQRVATDQTKAVALFVLVVGCSLAGYVWFLVRYPSDQGDAIKATYMLQVFPIVALMVGNLLYLVHEKSAVAYIMILGLLGAVFLHNLPALITRYLPW